eukprot:TRINITY_DN10086_c0_g1_i2.p1 TRINITY_DN10086_c0_g1~~TRINITY_DN10086_c0_g1_i2.p1  ORF type:complete len:234 (+),score=2.61 TRINITY_DN10086_c0_g1_i2:49-702(+)
MKASASFAFLRAGRLFRQRKTLSANLFHITSYRPKEKEGIAKKRTHLAGLQDQPKNSRNNSKTSLHNYQDNNQNFKSAEYFIKININYNRKNSGCNDVLLLFKTSQRFRSSACNGCVNYFARSLLKQRKAKQSAKDMKKLNRKSIEQNPSLVSRSAKINYRRSTANTQFTGINKLTVQKPCTKKNKQKQYNTKTYITKHTKSFAELFDYNNSLLSPW